MAEPIVDHLAAPGEAELAESLATVEASGVEVVFEAETDDHPEAPCTAELQSLAHPSAPLAEPVAPPSYLDAPPAAVPRHIHPLDRDRIITVPDAGLLPPGTPYVDVELPSGIRRAHTLESQVSRSSDLREAA